MARIGKTKPLQDLLQSCPPTPQNEMNHMSGNQRNVSQYICRDQVVKVLQCAQKEHPGLSHDIFAKWMVQQFLCTPQHTWETMNTIYGFQSILHEPRMPQNLHHSPNDSNREARNRSGDFHLISHATRMSHSVHYSPNDSIHEARNRSDYFHQILHESRMPSNVYHSPIDSNHESRSKSDYFQPTLHEPRMPQNVHHFPNDSNHEARNRFGNYQEVINDTRVSNNLSCSPSNIDISIQERQNSSQRNGQEEDSHSIRLPQSQPNKSVTNVDSIRPASNQQNERMITHSIAQHETLVLNKWIRGSTKLSSCHPKKGEIHKCFFYRGTPVGDEAKQLTNYLGVYAKNSILFTLYKEWDKEHVLGFETSMDDLMNDFEFFMFDGNLVANIEGVDYPVANMEEVVYWCYAKMKKKVRSWHNTLKLKMDPKLPDQACQKSPDPRVTDNDWQKLLKYWKLPEKLEESARNKSSRGAPRPTHTTGGKSYSRLKRIKYEVSGKHILNTIKIKHDLIQMNTQRGNVKKLLKSAPKDNSKSQRINDFLLGYLMMYMVHIILVVKEDMVEEFQDKDGRSLSCKE